ncbi:hypothetical protein IPH70_03630 [Candidatus Roizmanbacteria bacterium]|nr:MAG: hypothetical protein IPH70_03630 [Candidatus Roizmanbacteria bacterium]
MSDVLEQFFRQSRIVLVVEFHPIATLESDSAPITAGSLLIGSSLDTTGSADHLELAKLQAGPFLGFKFSASMYHLPQVFSLAFCTVSSGLVNGNFLLSEGSRRLKASLGFCFCALCLSLLS